MAATIEATTAYEATPSGPCCGEEDNPELNLEESLPRR